jgi:hypothetical protein
MAAQVLGFDEFKRRPAWRFQAKDKLRMKGGAAAIVLGFGLAARQRARASPTAP